MCFVVFKIFFLFLDSISCITTTILELANYVEQAEIDLIEIQLLLSLKS